MSYPNQAESNSAATSSPREQRRHARFAFSATVQAVEIKSGARITGRTTELGMGGCYVETISPFPAGTELRIRILRENEGFEARARVVYGMIGMGMGLAFVSAQPKHVKIFQRWVQEVRGQSASTEEARPRGASAAAPAQETKMLKNVVLSDLIMTLMQKNVLTDGEGKDLLRKLFRPQV